MNGLRKVRILLKYLLEKYSKFKAVDIFKSLKQGVVPKRGGPKETEDEISKELNDINIENQNNEKQKVLTSNAIDDAGHGSNIDINAIDANQITYVPVESKQTDNNNYNINLEFSNTNIKQTNIRDTRSSMDRDDIN
jgi:hypothetical protein